MHESPETTQAMHELTPLASRGGIIRDIIYISTVAHKFREEFINEIDFPKGDKLSRRGKRMTM